MELELQELFNDLELALKQLSDYSGGYSGEFLSAEDFHDTVSRELNKLKDQNVPDFKNIWLWFAPTSAWDDFVGIKGLELGNRIFEKVSQLYKFDG